MSVKLHFQILSNCRETAKNLGDTFFATPCRTTVTKNWLKPIQNFIVTSIISKMLFHYLLPVLTDTLLISSCNIECTYKAIHGRRPATLPSISSMYVYLYQNWLARGRIVTARSHTLRAWFTWRCLYNSTKTCNNFCKYLTDPQKMW